MDRLFRNLNAEKIEFPADMARDGIVETMFAQPVGDNLRLKNSPFHVYGVSFQDVVAAERVNGRWLFSGVVARGGHSTYRIRLVGTEQEEAFSSRWPALDALGCTYEEGGHPGRRLYAVDIPPAVDVHAAYALLEKGESDGAWAFEEAHYEPPSAN